MSLARGIQSAIFHYLSCAPCTGYAYRKKRRKDAKRDRLERARTRAMQSPDEEVYEHPEPSNTNPFWNEEIALGPTPPPRKRGGRKNGKMERSGTAMSGSTAASKRSLGSRTAGESMEAVVHGGLKGAVDSVRTSIETLGDNWNRKRYQREDEDLWGLTDDLPDSRMGSIRQQSATGSSIGLAGASRPGTAYSSNGSYYTARAPPVNDLHPPVVSMLSSNVHQSKWMLQPPPKAAVQLGKERPSPRSRSGSATSSKVSLNRRISERRVHEMQILETPDLPAPAPVARSGPYNNSQKGRGQGSQSPVNTTTSDLSLPLPVSRPSIKERREARNRAKQLSATESPESGSASETPLNMSSTTRSPALNAAAATHLTASGFVRVTPTRPNLPTIVSQESSQQAKENAHPSSVSTSPTLSPGNTSPPTSGSIQANVPLTLKAEKLKKLPLARTDDSSLNVLQDLVSPETLLDSKFVRSPVIEARIRLPPVDHTEEVLLLDGDWVEARGELKRWSMDI